MMRVYKLLSLYNREKSQRIRYTETSSLSVVRSRETVPKEQKKQKKKSSNTISTKFRTGSFLFDYFVQS